MNAIHSVPILIGLTVTGISAAYLLYLRLRKVRAVFLTFHFGNDSLVERTALLRLLEKKSSVFNYFFCNFISLTYCGPVTQICIFALQV
jgi:hypothetical protein